MISSARLRDRLSRARFRPGIIAHRGVWTFAPENSVAAIAAAAAYDVVEIDAQLSVDGVPVLMHDATLERMAGDPRDVGEMTAADLTAISLRAQGGGEAVASTNETIPTLLGALDAAPKDLVFDVDVKILEEIEAVARALAASPHKDRCSVKIDVASPADARRLSEMEDRFGFPVIAKVALRGLSDIDLIEAAAAYGTAAAELSFDDLDLLRAARDASELTLSTYTLDPVHCCGLSDSKALIDPDSVWGTLLAAGIDMIMTDQPAALAAYIGIYSATE